jgi:hypothetical protein
MYETLARAQARPRRALTLAPMCTSERVTITTQLSTPVRSPRPPEWGLDDGTLLTTSLGRGKILLSRLKLRS